MNGKACAKNIWRIQFGLTKPEWGAAMSDEGINKFKSMLKGRTEAVAELAGQKLGAVAFEARKAYEAASPMAKSALAELAEAAKLAKNSFKQAMSEAEARAVGKGAEAAERAAEDAKPPGGH